MYFYLAQNPVMDENAIAQYAVVPADITAGRHLGTLITSMFLHANLLHVAGNMLFLWIFGNNVEDKLGELKFLIVYFASGIGGSLLQIFITPDSTVPMLGASGAISGLLAAYQIAANAAFVLASPDDRRGLSPGEPRRSGLPRRLKFHCEPLTPL